jgi:transposase
LALPDILAGKGASEIAKLHGVDESTVRRWMAEIKPGLLDGEKNAIERAREMLEEKTGEALERLWELTQSADQKVRLGAINSWLDRGGVVKTERREHSGPGGGAQRFELALAEAEAAASRKKEGE